MAESHLRPPDWENARAQIARSGVLTRAPIGSSGASALPDGLAATFDKATSPCGVTRTITAAAKIHNTVWGDWERATGSATTVALCGAIRGCGFGSVAPNTARSRLLQSATGAHA
jgi:hypothetical protein